MVGLGSAIGMGMQAVGSVFGGIAASKAMKNVKNNLNKQREDNRNWYDRRYNEDSTQRADAQAVIEQTRKSILERNRQAAGSQAVMGGTEESVAAAKASNNEALSNAMSTIAVNADRRKDMIEQQYQAKDEALQSELNDLERAKAANVSQAIQGVADAAGGLSEIIK